VEDDEDGTVRTVGENLDAVILMRDRELPHGLES
jgi:hypothetical protein